MKVLNINIKDRTGGAGIAAYRHNEAMRRSGIDAQLLALNVTDGNNTSVIKLDSHPLYITFRAWLNNVLCNLKIKRCNPYGTWSYSCHGFNIVNENSIKDADIIVLHWINEGMLSIKGISEILKLGKPVYWFMHDMWPITGGCHYSLSCKNYTLKCGKCPMFKYKRKCKKDYSSKQLAIKQKLWCKYDNLKIITPSKWLADCATESSLFHNQHISLVKNVIDTNIYKPIDKTVARRILGLPQHKKLILFGADSINSPYKGWNILKDALSNFNSTEIQCVIFGNANNWNIQDELPLKVTFIGRLRDDYSLMLLYNACDVFVTPSIADNFPNVLIESMACGLPCVGFNIGGIPEIISHIETGFVVDSIDSKALANGIKWIIEHPFYDNLCVNANKKILQECSFESAIKNNVYWKLFKNEN